MLADLLAYGSLLSALVVTGLRLFITKPYAPIFPPPHGKPSSLAQEAEPDSANA